MKKQDLKEKQAWVIGLIIECPLMDPLESCPAKELRTLPIQDSTRIIYNMEESQLNDIIVHHQMCLGVREDIMLRRKEE